MRLFSQDTKVQALKGVPLFEGLSRKELVQLARVCEDLEIQPGKVLCNEGQLGREVFVIVDGTVQVTRKGRRVATLRSGDFVGEIAVITEMPCNATVTAETPVRLFALTGGTSAGCWIRTQASSVRCCGPSRGGSRRHRATPRWLSSLIPRIRSMIAAGSTPFRAGRDARPWPSRDGTRPPWCCGPPGPGFSGGHHAPRRRARRPSSVACSHERDRPATNWPLPPRAGPGLPGRPAGPSGGHPPDRAARHQLASHPSRARGQLSRARADRQEHHRPAHGRRAGRHPGHHRSPAGARLPAPVPGGVPGQPTDAVGYLPPWRTEYRVHVHVVPASSPEVAAMWGFRDALQADPRLRRQYAALKWAIVAGGPVDPLAFTRAKHDWIVAALGQLGLASNQHPRLYGDRPTLPSARLAS